MDPLIIPLDDRRARLAERMDLVGHGTAALGLLSAAMGGLPARTEGATALVAVQLAAAAALAVAIVRELRSRDKAELPRISWLNLIAAAVLLFPWYMELRGGGKAFSPALVSGIVAGGLAFLHPVIQRRRRSRYVMRIDDAGLTLAWGPFRRISAAWGDLRAVEATPDALRLVMADGREQRVRLRMLGNRVEVASAVASAADQKGVERIGIPSRAAFEIAG
ncbi:MAG TPA: hypothetical protein VLK84_15705 [Longimicrobium sp.]|nr:hypothetical protein [Longimicrobium sp.]